MNLKLLKFILFLPLFIACQAGSEILPPDSGENGGTPDFSCILSAESLVFDHAYDYAPYALSAVTGDETVVVDLSKAPWMEVEGDVTVIYPNTEVTLNLVPAEPNYSSSPRSGVIVLRGKYTGEFVEVAVTQGGSYQDIDESLLNGWRLDSELALPENWKKNATMMANTGDSKGLLTLEHSVNSDVTVIEDEKRGTFTGMRPGDAVLLRAPVRNLAAGTDVSAMINLGHKTAGGKSKWVAEYWDEEKWNEIRKFNTCNDDGEFNYSTFICDFTLNESLENDYVKLRFRLISGDEDAVYFVAASPWTGAAMEVNSACPPVTDYKKVLILGDSFTYYWNSPFVLKQLARSQGHRLDLRVHTEPGATLSEHNALYSLSDDAVLEGGYHYAILQEQSTVHAEFADGNTSVLSEINNIATVIKTESLSCKIILENTWAYAGDQGDYEGYDSYENFDARLQLGCAQMASSLRAEVSPVGLAFAKARETYPEINCLHSDERHPSCKGAYLKSCVNYLKLYGGDFNASPYEGEMESADEAAALRTLAYDAVNYVPEEKPKVTLTFDFSSSWPFTPELAKDAKGNNKIKTKEPVPYTYTQDEIEYPIEIWAPIDGYYYNGSALRFENTTKDNPDTEEIEKAYSYGYVKLPVVKDKALVSLEVGITNTSNKTIFLSSDASDKGDILKNKKINAGSSAVFELTGTLPNVSYYLYSKSGAEKIQIGKVVLTYE